MIVPFKIYRFVEGSLTCWYRNLNNTVFENRFHCLETWNLNEKNNLKSRGCWWKLSWPGKPFSMFAKIMLQFLFLVPKLRNRENLVIFESISYLLAVWPVHLSFSNSSGCNQSRWMRHARRLDYLHSKAYRYAYKGRIARELKSYKRNLFLRKNGELNCLRLSYSPSSLLRHTWKRGSHVKAPSWVKALVWNLKALVDVHPKQGRASFVWLFQFKLEHMKNVQHGTINVLRDLKKKGKQKQEKYDGRGWYTDRHNIKKF